MSGPENPETIADVEPISQLEAVVNAAAGVPLSEIAPAGKRFIPFRKWSKLASIVGVTLAVGFAIGMRQGRQKLEKTNKSQSES
jgi:hypothetical protein